MQNKARMEAKISLARLGVKKYFDEFVTGLSSSNVTWQADCIDHLGEIGDKRAIESLIPFLNEKEYPPIANITISSPHPGAHRYAVATLSVSSNALAALAKLLPDEYANLGAKRPTHRITPGEWRTWLNQHRDHLKDLSK
jgi:HEAT repeat protein